MQAPVVAADTFAHAADSAVRGVVASLPGGGRVSALLLVAIIVGVNVILILAALRGFKTAGGIKAYLSDFPSHNAGTALALILIFETGLVILIRLALGLVFPDNYDTWIWALVGLAGVNVAGLGIKRVTDDRYVAAKTAGKMAGAAGVTVEGDATITTTAERRAVVPQAGVKPTDPAITASLEALAKKLQPTFGGSSQ